MSISFSEDAQQEVVTSSRVLPEDSGEGSLRPRLLKDYTGQEKAKENLQVCIDAARLRGEPLDHVLLYGPPGLGKTTMAAVIANEMGVNMRITSGPAIEKAGDLAALLTNLQEHDILFVDEIHRLNRSVEEVLYPAMEDFALDIVIGKGPAARSIRLDIPKFTLVAATTRSGMLTGPLRDRFGISYRLDYYTVEELAQIVTRSATILGVAIDHPSALEIGSRSRGTPRVAGRNGNCRTCQRDTPYCQPPAQARARLRTGARQRSHRARYLSPGARVLRDRRARPGLDGYSYLGDACQDVLRSCCGTYDPCQRGGRGPGHARGCL